jgi:3-hydroxybutyrate dehydrogenase
MNLQNETPTGELDASAVLQAPLADKVAVITGAASGIGKEIALAFARAGAKVVIADLDQHAALEAASDIDPMFRRALGMAMDVSNEEQVEAGMARAIETFGRIDILISNAGVQIVAPLVAFEFAKWKKLLSIHLDGAFLTTRAALRQMYRQKSGSIIYMGSVHSKEASQLKAPYVTSKHGLIGLAKVVAKEGAAYGVRANVICPGFVRTPLVEKQIPEQARELGISEAEVVKTVMLKETVDGEFTTVRDVADVAVFLAAFPSNAAFGCSRLRSTGVFSDRRQTAVSALRSTCGARTLLLPDGSRPGNDRRHLHHDRE